MEYLINYLKTIEIDDVILSNNYEIEYNYNNLINILSKNKKNNKSIKNCKKYYCNSILESCYLDEQFNDLDDPEDETEIKNRNKNLLIINIDDNIDIELKLINSIEYNYYIIIDSIGINDFIKISTHLIEKYFNQNNNKIKYLFLNEINEEIKEYLLINKLYYIEFPSIPSINIGNQDINKMTTYVLYINNNEKERFKNTYINNKLVLNTLFFEGIRGTDKKNSYEIYLKTNMKYIYDKMKKLSISKPVQRNVRIFLNNYIEKNGKMIKSIGAFGHILSFIELLEHAEKTTNDNEYIMILEPDVIFHKHFYKLLDSYKTLITDNNIIYLGSCQTNWKNITIRNWDDMNYYHSNINSYGTFSIILKKTILNEYIKLLYVKMITSDVCIYFINCHKIVLYPNIVIADLSDSLIREKKDMNQKSKEFKWNLHEYLL